MNLNTILVVVPGVLVGLSIFLLWYFLYKLFTGKTIKSFLMKRSYLFIIAAPFVAVMLFIIQVGSSSHSAQGAIKSFIAFLPDVLWNGMLILFVIGMGLVVYPYKNSELEKPIKKVSIFKYFK